MKKKIFIIIVFTSCILYSCGSLLYMPSVTDPVQQERLLKGRKLYVEICSSCHNLHLPKSYTAEEWKQNIDKMQKRAKISDEQKELIYEYVTSHP